MSVFNDTHEVIKQLAAEGGMSERGAEILVTALNRGLSDSIATKGDLELLESRLSNKLYAVGIAMVGLIVTAQHFLK